jgi:RNA polymerase sigma-70 factor (ECF subfamily)
MPRKPSSSDPECEPRECAARIRAAVEREHALLLRSVALLVARTEKGLAWLEVLERASEVLHEAVREALRQAADFDPTRSAAAWVRGIAARLLLSRRRAEARARRCVPATVLGDEAWAAVLEQLATGPPDETVAGRLDLEQALARLAPDARRALERRYWQGLDGAALAAALGVATAGAARVRVCRALQALRAQLIRPDEEALP